MTIQWNRSWPEEWLDFHVISYFVIIITHNFTHILTTTTNLYTYFIFIFVVCLLFFIIWVPSRSPPLSGTSSSLRRLLGPRISTMLTAAVAAEVAVVWVRLRFTLRVIFRHYKLFFWAASSHGRINKFINVRVHLSQSSAFSYKLAGVRLVNYA